MARWLITRWRVLRHPRNWQRQLRWWRNDHHGHVRPDSTRHDKTDDRGRKRHG